MKKLLLLTDFTKNAAHAAASACSMAAKLKANLLLYHSIQYMPIVPEFANGSMVTETNDIIFNDCEQKLADATKDMKTVAAKADTYEPQISYESGEGSLGENIRMLTARQDIEMVVMGGRSGGALDHLLTGSETTAVINASLKPVLIIPPSTDIFVFKKLVMATDFHAGDINTLDFLTEFTQALGMHLEVVHVANPGDVVNDVQPELLFRRYLNGLQQGSVSYHQLSGENVSKHLMKYCRKNNANLLAVTHQRHGWLADLFGRSESVTLLEEQDLAVLVFPPAVNAE